MEALRPTKEKTGRQKTAPFLSISPSSVETDKVRDSFTPIDEEVGDLSARWSIGVERGRVMLYVAIALIAGFALGFGSSQFIGGKKQSPQLLTGTGKQPEDLPAASTPSSGSNEFHRVTRIARGDTIEVEGVGRVRMIGIETPDGKPPQELYGQYGVQAVKLVETMLLSQEVRLEPESATRADGDRTQAGETLAYVYKRDGTLVNGEMLKEGLALVRSGEEFGLSDQFRSLEREAMQSLRGIWGASVAGTSSSTIDQNKSTASHLPSESKPKLSPLSPSAIGPNISATTSGTTSSEPVVFVSGDKTYHNKANCDLLDKKRKTMGLSEAKAQGYMACSRCYPSHTMQVK
jgi:micrococcal nuclease